MMSPDDVSRPVVPRRPPTRGMLRWLINLLSAVSLLLLAAVLALWVRGYWATDHVWLVYRDGGAEFVRSSRGRLTVRHVMPNVRGVPLPQRVSHWSCRPHSQLPPAPSPRHREWGVFVYEGTPGATRQEVERARAALREVEAAKADPASLTAPPAPAPAPAYDPKDPASQRAYVQWIQTRAAPDPRELLWRKEVAAREVLEGSHYHEWTSPAWFAAVATAVLPSATLLAPAYRRRLRRKRGQCPGCGYDLRESRERCPECGRESGRKTTAAQFARPA